jgi:hypothetical protein
MISLPGLFVTLASLAAAPWQAMPHPLENAYVRVVRNAAPCAVATPSMCGARVLVALGPIDIVDSLHHRHMERGDIAVFRWFESYTPPATGEFVEVSLKQDHPPVETPPVPVPPGKNALLFDSDTFFVFEERLDPGETRPRHSHSQRVVIVINDTTLQQWVDGRGEIVQTEVADDVRFNAPVTHSVKTIGDKPLRNIVIELKP